MSGIQFTATVRLGSPAQLRVGILGTGTLHMWCNGMRIADLYGWRIRQTKNGLAPLPPSRNAGPDPQNPGKDRYFSCYRIYPENRDLYQQVTKTVMDAYFAAGGTRGDTAKAPVNTGPPAQTVGQSYPSTGDPARAPAAPQAPQAPAPSSPPPPPQGVSQAPAPAAPATADDWPYP